MKLKHSAIIYATDIGICNRNTIVGDVLAHTAFVIITKNYNDEARGKVCYGQLYGSFFFYSAHVRTGWSTAQNSTKLPQDPQIFHKYPRLAGFCYSLSYFLKFHPPKI